MKTLALAVNFYRNDKLNSIHEYNVGISNHELCAMKQTINNLLPSHIHKCH